MQLAPQGPICEPGWVGGAAHLVELAVYSSLFAASFLAATILPFSSEAALAAALLAGQQPWSVLIAVASTGNILGSAVNWGIGRAAAGAAPGALRIDPQKLERAEHWYRKYGRWSLLLSWVPVIGDPLTVAAGFLREPFWIFLALVAIAKIGRYLVVAAILLNWI